MIIYEVTLFINKNIFAKYKDWLISHVHGMLKFEGFMGARILAHSDYHHELEKSLIVHYHVDSIMHLNDYFNRYADAMRQKGVDLFGDQYRAERRILTFQSEHQQGATI